MALMYSYGSVGMQKPLDAQVQQTSMDISGASRRVWGFVGGCCLEIVCVSMVYVLQLGCK